MKLLSDYCLVSKCKDGRKAAIACYKLAERTLFDGFEQPEIAPKQAPMSLTGETGESHGRDRSVSPVRISTGYEPNLLTKPGAASCPLANAVSPEAKDAAAAESKFVEKLKEQGLSAAEAVRYVQTADPTLLREVFAFLSEKTDLRDPGRAVRSLLNRPSRWGFQRSALGWQRPVEAIAACNGRLEAELEKLVKTRERRERERLVRRVDAGPC